MLTYSCILGLMEWGFVHSPISSPAWAGCIAQVSLLGQKAMECGHGKFDEIYQTWCSVPTMQNMIVTIILHKLDM